MARQSPARPSRWARSADADRDESRSWLSHGFAALGISALGLAVAGSVALTTSAETTHSASDGANTGYATLANPAEAPTTSKKPAKRESSAARAFARRDATDPGTRSAAVRRAIVKEQAAQRAEELAKSAEDVTEADRAAASDARQKTLDEANNASRESAAQLVQESLRRTAAARVAAASDRQAAETSESTSTTTTIPTGGRGSSPVPGAVIGAHFGQYGIWSRYHTGLDFRAAYGTPIRAVLPGVVLYAGNSGDWAGNHVAVKHADGQTTMYSHMSSMAAHAGQIVQAGQVIGYVGQTGRAFGAHLHFELYPVGVKYGDVYKAINPGPWLVAHGVQTH